MLGAEATQIRRALDEAASDLSNFGSFWWGFWFDLIDDCVSEVAMGCIRTLVVAVTEPLAESS